VRQPKGHPEAPLSDPELLDKMTWLLPSSPARLLEACHRLSTIEDVENLVELCRVGQP
jgi:hypothetical protein